MKNTINVCLLLGIFQILNAQTDSIQITHYVVNQNQVFQSFLYQEIPVHQAKNYKTNTTIFVQEQKNQLANNIYMSQSIYGPMGFSNVETSRTINLPANATDSFSFTGATLNQGKGAYDLFYHFDPSLNLANTIYDTVKHTLVLNDSTYQKDDPNTYNGFRYHNPSSALEFELGTIFKLDSVDTISSMSFYLDKLNFRHQGQGTVRFNLYRLDPNGQLSSVRPIFKSKQYRVSNFNNGNRNWLSLELDRQDGLVGDTVKAGLYLASVIADQFFGQDTIFFGYNNLGNFPSNMFRINSGSWSGWNYTSNQYPIRLNVSTNQCPELNATISTTDPSSCQAKDGEVNIQMPKNGTSPYQMFWNYPTRIVDTALKNVEAGVYMGILVDANGCKQKIEATLSDPSNLRVDSLRVTRATCSGECQGRIAFQPGGSSNYSFNWFDVNRNPLSVGGKYNRLDSVLDCSEAATYFVQLKDSSGTCSKWQRIEVPGQTEKIEINALTVLENKCFEDSTGSISTNSISGAQGSVKYIWSNGDTNSSIQDLTSGTYSLTISDDSLCQREYTWKIGPDSQLTIGVLGGGPSHSKLVDSTNAREFAFVPNIYGGKKPISIQWYNWQWRPCVSNSDGVIHIGNNEPFNQRYTYWSPYFLTIEDAYGCRDTVEFLHGPVSIENSALSHEVTIFPNPSDQIVNVRWSDQFRPNHIELYSADGQLLRQLEVYDNVQRNMTFQIYTKGLHFLKLSSEQGSVVKALVNQ